MSPIEVDFSEAESFEPLDEGFYPVVVSQVEIREGEKGPYLNWELDVTHDDFKGRRLWMVTSLAPKALFRLKEVFEALDVYQEKVEIDYDEDTGIVTSPELAGLACQAVVSQEAYQGRLQNRVNQILPVDGALPQAATSGTSGRGRPARRNFR